MRILPQPKTTTDRKKTAARLLKIQTIDQMHYRHGWIPGHLCRDCDAFIHNTCRRFYGNNKRISVSNMVRWLAKYAACGLFAKDGEPALRTAVRRVTTLPAGEEPVRIPRQKGLFG